MGEDGGGEGTKSTDAKERQVMMAAVYTMNRMNMTGCFSLAG